MPAQLQKRHGLPFIALLLAASCVGPVEPPLAPELEPCQLGISASELDFGTLLDGTSRDLPLTIRNLGQSRCPDAHLDLLAGSDPGYGLVTPLLEEMPLEAAEERTVWVRSAPGAQRFVRLTGQLELRAGATSVGTVALTTVSDRRCLFLAPSEGDFGSVQTGCGQVARTFSLYNLCPETVVLAAVQLEEPGCEAASSCSFHLLAGAGPGVVSPIGGSPPTVQVRFKPVKAGPAAASVTITTVEKGQQVSYSVRLEGAGREVDPVTFVWVMEPLRQVDILFVLDDGLAMKEHQRVLEAKLRSFVESSLSLWHDTSDYRFAVTSADEGASALSVASGDSPGEVEQFLEKARLGARGTALPKPLSVAYQALTTPRSTGFPRPDSDVHVVIVTNAEDRSAGSAESWARRFRELAKFRQRRVGVHVVGPFGTGQPPSCTYETGAAGAPRLATVAQQTRGVWGDLCESRWPIDLDGVGTIPSNPPRRTFFLPAAPDASNGLSLTVTLNGEPVPPSRDGQTVWSYDSVANALVFVEPASGTLLVSFVPACF